MKIENLVREKVIGNIKIGTKGANGLPKKLPYFNVEEDKATSKQMVEIFKKLYPDKPTKLKIMFTSEDPFNFKYKRYVKGKVVCIGNDSKAITIGKDSNNRNTQIEIECNENCKQRVTGACKLVGSLKFVLIGIDAGGLWKITTSGGWSLSNIATEIVRLKKANIPIKGIPFELTLTEHESIGYGVYYSMNLCRADIVPKLTGEVASENSMEENEPKKQLIEGKSEAIIEQEKMTPEENIENTKTEETSNSNVEEKSKEDFSNYLTLKKFMPTVIGKGKFTKIIFQDINLQDVEYILHPKASQEILKYGSGTVIEMKKSKIEMEKNILCEYVIKSIIEPDGTEKTIENELKEAV